MVIKKPELVRRISKATGYRSEDISAVVDALVDVIKNSVSNGEMVKMRGFLTLSLKEVAGREVQNFHTGERMKIPGRHKIKVTVADTWNEKVK